MKKPLTPYQREQKRAQDRAYYERKIGRPVRKVLFGSFRNDPKAYHLKWHLEKKYGITFQQYNEMVSAQGGACAICGSAPTGENHTSKRLCVDHDHATGSVRGLLCWKCNTVIGLIADSPNLIESMRRYIHKHSQLRLVG